MLHIYAKYDYSKYAKHSSYNVHNIIDCIKYYRCLYLKRERESILQLSPISTLSRTWASGWTDATCMGNQPLLSLSLKAKVKRDRPRKENASPGEVRRNYQ